MATAQRRRALLPIDARVLINMLLKLQAGHSVFVEGLAEDVRVVGSYHDWQHDTLMLALESETFDAVDEGVVLPRINITFHVPND